MNQEPDRLYKLLPAVYRQQDRAQGLPLQALLAIVEQQLLALEHNMQTLYDNWFIETCEEWVVPYIGDLLGVRGLDDSASNIVTQRVRVANTLSYRRRKGITPVLEQVIVEVTNWYAMAVVFREFLSINQHVQDVKLLRGRTIDLRQTRALEELDGPFDPIAHRIDIRTARPGDAAATRPHAPAAQLGKYNLPNLGIFIWRLRNYPLVNRAARIPAVQTVVLPGAYTFDPLERDIPLFCMPRAKTSVTEATERYYLPIRLTRQLLHDDLTAYRHANADVAAPPPDSTYYGPQRGLWITVDDAPLGPLQVVSADLASWDDPATPPHAAAIDVELGRLLLNPSQLADTTAVTVGYNYGFSADMGGGPYNQLDNDPPLVATIWTRSVNTAAELIAAIDEWNGMVTPTSLNEGVIYIIDSNLYRVGDQTLQLPGSGALAIRALNGQRPCLAGNLTLLGRPSDPGNYTTPTMTISGLLVAGQIIIRDNLDLHIVHTTLVPTQARPSLTYVPATAADSMLNLIVTIQNSIVGWIRLPPAIGQLIVADSVVDATPAQRVAIAALGDSTPPPYGPSCVLERTTVFGESYVDEMPSALNMIFTEPVHVQRRQVGSIGYSYVPLGSDTPRRYRCQPDLALEASHAADDQIAARLRPAFTSRAYGDPGYAQLNIRCPPEISAGAEGGSEMGAFNQLNPAKRVGNLRAVLGEYLRIGFETALFYVT
jgi:hypothetical protein